MVQRNQKQFFKTTREKMASSDNHEPHYCNLVEQEQGYTTDGQAAGKAKKGAATGTYAGGGASEGKSPNSR